MVGHQLASARDPIFMLLEIGHGAISDEARIFPLNIYESDLNYLRQPRYGDDFGPDDEVKVDGNILCLLRTLETQDFLDKYIIKYTSNLFTSEGLNKTHLAVVMLSSEDYCINSHTFPNVTHSEFKNMWSVLEKVCTVDDDEEVIESIKYAMKNRSSRGYYRAFRC